MSWASSNELLCDVCEAYEETRRNVIEGQLENAKLSGYAVMLRNGFLAWTRLTMDRIKTQRRPESMRDLAKGPSASQVEALLANIILEHMEASCTAPMFIAK